jgi:hypothetical protein
LNWNPRNFFLGPGQWNQDLSIFKYFDITERMKVRFTSDFFNFFNHPNLFVAGGTNNIADNPTDSVEVTRGGLFSNINNVEQHRNIQLALKFVF